jgi:hypothetical protein
VQPHTTPFHPHQLFFITTLYWRDIVAVAIAIAVAVAVAVAIAVAVAVAFLLVIPEGDPLLLSPLSLLLSVLLHPSQHSSSRPKAAHFAAAAERSPHFALAVAFCFALSFASSAAEKSASPPLLPVYADCTLAPASLKNKQPHA